MRRLLSVLAVFASLSTVACAESVTIAGDYWMPVTGRYDDDEPGYGIEIVKKAFAGSGIDVKYAMIPWRRALQNVEAGVMDCVVGNSIKEGKGLLLSQEAIGIVTNAMIVKIDNDWRYQSLSSLNFVRVGVTQGYDYDFADFDTWVRKNPALVLKLSGTEAINTAIKMMLADRMDVFVESPMVFFYAAKKANAVDKFRIEREFMAPVPIFFSCSPINPERSTRYTELVDSSIQKMRKSGELSELLKKYGVSDWSKE